MKVLVAVGTRPEAVKLAPVVAALRATALSVPVVATGQHRALVDGFLRSFELRPSYELGAMRPGQPLSCLTARLLEGLDGVLAAERPDWIVVQGDTATAFAGALAGFHRRVRVCHVEAGLRTGDRTQPFPEEANRRLATVVTDLHCAPTDWARRNLLREGVPREAIALTGNTVVDALRSAAGDSAAPPAEIAAIPADRRIVLVTAHRRENFGAPLRAICAAVRDLVAARQDVHVVWPVHLNPHVGPVVVGELGRVDRVHVLDPLDYASFVGVLKRCTLALTDSGGVQEEAPSLGKPALVLRDVTERPEGVDAGVAALVGADRERIVRETCAWLDDEARRDRVARFRNIYGDGRAAERVVQALLAAAADIDAPHRAAGDLARAEASS
jgi:UDP-N-acetylglucosamine 2-epimerase (non-hydrolysing)